MRSENIPKTRLSCYQIAIILVPLQAIAVAQYDGTVDI